MPESRLVNIIRCPAPLGDGKCDSAVFYDWGLQVMERLPNHTITGDDSKFNNYASPTNVTICARCTTPYVRKEGDLVDISGELSAEDVKLILQRGQASLPQVKIKDP